MRAEMNEIEAKFKAKYRYLYHFLESTLWPDVDGFNPIELLHRLAYYGTAEWSQGTIDDLKAVSEDDDFGEDEISRLFNKEDVGFPHHIVTPENAKSFCFSMHQSLLFITSLKKHP